MKNEFPQQIFGKFSDVRFHENPSCGNRIIPCGEADGPTEKHTDITRLKIAFQSFANAPKIVFKYFGRDNEIYSSCIDYENIKLNLLYMHIYDLMYLILLNFTREERV